MAPRFLGFKLKNSVCGTFEGAQKSDEKSDSIQLVKLRFKSGGIRASEIDYMHLYPNRWNLVNQIEDYGQW